MSKSKKTTLTKFKSLAKSKNLKNYTNLPKSQKAILYKNLIKIRFIEYLTFYAKTTFIKLS